MNESHRAIMEDEDDSKLEELIRDLALKDRESTRDGPSSSPPPPVPPRPARRSAPDMGQRFDPNNGDLGLPLVNNNVNSKRENYSKIVLNKRMWVSLKETEIECENISTTNKTG